MSDILDTILKGIPAEPAKPEDPPVQTPEQEKKSSMTYSGDFEKQYGKKT